MNLITLAQSSASASIISMLIMFVPLILIFWFMQRSQKKQQAKQREFLDELKPGQRIVTIGGLHGIISEIDRDKKIVTIDCDGVYLDFDLQAIRKTI